MTIVLDMHCFAKMVDSRESLANWIDLFDLAMMKWEMAVVTSCGKVAYFATFHYITKHYTEETEKKRMDQWAYLFVVAMIGDTD